MLLAVALKCFMRIGIAGTIGPVNNGMVVWIFGTRIRLVRVQ